MRNSATHDRGGRALLIVLASVLVLLALAVGWLYWRPPATQPSPDEGREVAESFLVRIREGNADQAWGSTTAEFKSAQGREKFLAYVKPHKFLSKPLGFVSMQTVTVQQTPRAEYSYRSADGQATVRLLVGNENGTWRVDRMAINQP